MITTLAEYQKEAARTLIDKPDSTYTNEQLLLVWRALALGAAAGALIDYVKKGIFHQHGIDGERVQRLARAVLFESQILVDWAQLEIIPDTPESIQLDDSDIMLMWNVLGLMGEAGEVAEQVHGSVLERSIDQGAPRAELRKELGDVIWYVAALATKSSTPLDEIASANIDKLRKRYGAAGYTAEQSRARVDQ